MNRTKKGASKNAPFILYKKYYSKLEWKFLQ